MLTGSQRYAPFRSARRVRAAIIDHELIIDEQLSRDLGIEGEAELAVCRRTE